MPALFILFLEYLLMTSQSFLETDFGSRWINGLKQCFYSYVSTPKISGKCLLFYERRDAFTCLYSHFLIHFLTKHDSFQKTPGNGFPAGLITLKADRPVDCSHHSSCSDIPLYITHVILPC